MYIIIIQCKSVFCFFFKEYAWKKEEEVPKSIRKPDKNVTGMMRSKLSLEAEGSARKIGQKTLQK